MAAKRKLSEGQYNQALKLYEHSRVSHQHPHLSHIPSLHSTPTHLSHSHILYILTLSHLSHYSHPHIQCAPWEVIDAFTAVQRVPELVQYLYQLVHNDNATLTHPKQVEDLLLLCFAHEVYSQFHTSPTHSLCIQYVMYTQ